MFYFSQLIIQVIILCTVVDISVLRVEADVKLHLKITTQPPRERLICGIVHKNNVVSKTALWMGDNGGVNDW